MDILVFELEGQRFGLPLGSVREVVRAVATKPLPGAPRIVEGVVNYRGTVVPVLDFRARFGLPPRPLDPADHFIVARAHNRLVAAHVDRSSWPVHVPDPDVDDLAGSIAAAPRVTGVAKLPDGLVLIHDLDAFLSDSEAVDLDHALASAPEEAGA